MNENDYKNVSATSKDFQSIYTELLDLIPTLTDKWRPDTSNESDPGILLIKLAAILADKNNYNIDKESLEKYPLSVTQIANARQIYDALGYNMSWYRSATGKIKLVWTSEKALTPIEIPVFTRICNSDNTLVFTVLNGTSANGNYLSRDTDSAIENRFLELNVIQGKPQSLDTDGNPIRLSDLDENLRLYFSEKEIAENGVFIFDYKSDNKYDITSKWSQVTNLAGFTDSDTTKLYQFCIDPISSEPYIQFPENVASLMPNGLHIVYILSNGENGNVGAGTITKFLDDMPIDKSAADSKTFNDCIRVIQSESFINGKDYETIDEAYRNHKKVQGTFNTLVTTRDYANYIKRYISNETRQEIVSNIQTTDYMSDPNDTTKVVEVNANGFSFTYNVAENSVFKKGDIIQHQVLKLYPLQYSSNYETSFNLDIDAETIDDINNSITEVKAITQQTQYCSDTEPYAYINLAKLNIQIIPHTKVTQGETRDIIKNVKNALQTRYNAYNLEYGKAIDYEELVRIVENSDNRIKMTIIDTPIYKIQSAIGNELSNVDKDTIVAKSILAGNVSLFSKRESYQEFGMQNYISYNSIKSVTTEAKIPANTTGTKLNPNEVLEIIHPKLYVDTTYGYGVNYKITLGENHKIERDLPYRLTTGDLIELTYHDTNSKTQNVEIKPGDIVTLSFDVNEDKTAVFGISETIITNKINSISIPAGTQCIYLTSSSSKEILAKESIVIGTNEALVYKDRASSTIAILYEGTTLTNNSENGKITFKVLSNSIENVLSDTQEINWENSAINLTISAQEMVIDSFANSSTTPYYVTCNDTIVEFTNDLKLLSEGKYIKIYEGEEISDEKLIKTYIGTSAGSIEYFKVRSRLNIVTDEYLTQTLDTRDSIKFTDKDDNLLGSLSNISLVFDIPLALQGGEDVSTTTIDESANIVYLNAYSYIDDGNVVSNYKAARANTEYNYLPLEFTDNEAKCIISVDAKTNTIDNSYAFPVFITGLIEDEKVEVSIDTGLTINKFNTEIKDISNGYTLLQIKNPTNTLTNAIITFTKPNNSTITISVGNITKLNGFNTDDINVGDIDTTGYNASDKYNITDPTTDNNNQTILERVLTIISRYDNFDWINTISNVNFVKQPTLSTSFFNANHVCNRLVLPKIDFEKSNISVVKSYIE